MDPNLVFSPSGAIKGENRRLFAGRHSEFARALDSIGIAGGSLAIIGSRGIGKTSFAWQLMEAIRSGTVDGGPFAESERIRRIRIPKAIPLWVQCREEMGNIEGVLLALLRDGVGADRTLRELYPKVFADKKTRDAIDRTYEFNLAFAKATFKFQKDAFQEKDLKRKLEELSSQVDQTHRYFSEAVTRAEKSGGKDILVFVDEFDILPIKSGVANLIKAFPNVRFVFAGIAETSKELIDSPANVRRHLREVIIPPLNNVEINSIFETAQRITRELGKEIVFTKEFRDAIAAVSGGYPEIIHEIGYECLDRLREGKTFPFSLDNKFLRKVNRHLFGPNGERSRFQEIRQAVDGNKRREKILIALADFAYGWVLEDSLKRKIKHADRKDWHRNLERLQEAQILDRNEKHLRFASPILKVCVTNAINENVKLV